MGLETATYPNGLNANWPLGTDPKAQGDDHLRLLKTVLKDVFPAGWDDTNIKGLFDRAMAGHHPAYVSVTGNAGDLFLTKTLVVQSSVFRATSGDFFGVLSGLGGVVGITPGTRQFIQVYAQLYCVTDAVQIGEMTDAATFVNMSGVAQSHDWVMKFAMSGLWPTAPGKDYIIKLLANKSTSAPVTPLNAINFSGHCTA